MDIGSDEKKEWEGNEDEVSRFVGFRVIMAFSIARKASAFTHYEIGADARTLQVPVQPAYTGEGTSGSVPETTQTTMCLERRITLAMNCVDETTQGIQIRGGVQTLVQSILWSCTVRYILIRQVSHDQQEGTYPYNQKTSGCMASRVHRKSGTPT